MTKTNFCCGESDISEIELQVIRNQVDADILMSGLPSTERLMQEVSMLNQESTCGKRGDSER